MPRDHGSDVDGGLNRGNPEIDRPFTVVSAMSRMDVPVDVGAMIASRLGPDIRFISGQRTELSGGQGICFQIRNGKADYPGMRA